VRPRNGLLSALAAALLLAAGCQRLNDERSVHVMAGNIHEIGYSAPRYQQKLTVNVSSPGAPVTVYLVREGDESTAAQNKMNAGKEPVAPFAGKEKAEDITLEATIPAGTAYVLLIRSDKKNADVKVKVTGR
jgi:hypothetical protein